MIGTGGTSRITQGWGEAEKAGGEKEAWRGGREGRERARQRERGGEGERGRHREREGERGRERDRERDREREREERTGGVYLLSDPPSNVSGHCPCFICGVVVLVSSRLFADSHML